MKKEIEITVKVDGSVSLKPRGVAGPECLELTRELEEALGVVEQRELTAEYYRREVEADAGVRGRTRDA